MTELQLIEQDIITAQAERLIIQIARDQHNGMELDDIIDKYVFKVKTGIDKGWFNITKIKESI